MGKEAGRETKTAAGGNGGGQAFGGLFRKAALTRLSAGERIDEPLKVSRPSDWILTGTLLVLAAAAAVWSFLGDIPVITTGRGLVQPAGGIAEVLTQVGGTVWSEVPADETPVREGDLLIKINTQADLQQLTNALEKEKLAKEDYETQKRIHSVTVDMSRETGDRVKKLMKENIGKLEALYAEREEDRELTVKLFKKGYATKSDLLAADEALTASLQNRHAAQIGLAREEESEEAALIQKEQNLRHAEEEYLLAVEERKRLESAMRQHEIRAPIAGKVSEFTLKRGDSVPANTRICLIVGEGLPALVYAFFPAEDAERMKPGAEARIELDAFPADTYGKLLGRITALDSLPANADQVARSVGYSEALTKELASGPPVTRVTIALRTEDQGGRALYEKAGGGRPLTVASGMICRGSVVLEDRVPVTLIVPALKRWFGITTR
ncbi:MAG: HlyD family efflux transporter periplasmic adaptor subunit [Elusimicrobiota bacterium]